MLREAGHDVQTAKEAGLSEAEDRDLLTRAQDENRVLVTRDRDFGNLVFVQSVLCGVLYLRMNPSNEDAVHEELLEVLEQYDEPHLHAAFVVVEPGPHRYRRGFD